MKGTLHTALLAGVVALSGCMTTGYDNSNGPYRRGSTRAGARTYDYPVYARTGSGANARYRVCHNDRNALVVSGAAVQAHLNHGDYFGSCTRANRNQHDTWSRSRGNSARRAPAPRGHDDHGRHEHRDDHRRRGRGRH